MTFLYYPRSPAHAVFGCMKNVEGVVAFLTCVTSRVERWYGRKDLLNVSALRLRTARRAKVPGNVPKVCS